MLNVNLRDVMPLIGCKGTANRRQYKIKKELFSFLLLRCSVPYLKVLQILDKTKKSRQSIRLAGFLKLLMIYAFTATEIQSKTNEQIPNATIPTVQIASANLVEHALWKVGSGLSLCLMNIAFTMSR